MSTVSTHTYFVQPRLRAGLRVNRTDTGFALDYRKQSIDLTVPSVGQQEVQALLDRLVEGTPVAELAVIAAYFDGLDSLLDELDRLGLLTEADSGARSIAITGADLHHLVQRFVRRQRATLNHSVFYEAMRSGSTTRAQLLGYAIEYHHVVAASPALIAPALAHAWTHEAYLVLQGFLKDEIGHDD